MANYIVTDLVYNLPCHIYVLMKYKKKVCKHLVCLISVSPRTTGRSKKKKKEISNMQSVQKKKKGEANKQPMHFYFTLPRGQQLAVAPSTSSLLPLVRVFKDNLKL